MGQPKKVSAVHFLDLKKAIDTVGHKQKSRRMLILWTVYPIFDLLTYYFENKTEFLYVI